jgi:protein-S-isoprenylcysteine O-methyltransferase Ste14
MTHTRVIVALWLVLIGYWTASAWGNKPDTFRMNPVWRLLFIALLASITAATRFLPRPLDRRILPDTPWVQAACVAAVCLGVGFAIWARRTLGRNWSGNPTLKEGHELIQSGPYRWIRHPIYTGILLAVLGTLASTGRLQDLPGLVFVLAACAAKMRAEERLMCRQFPGAYPSYRERTKALVPFVW